MGSDSALAGLKTYPQGGVELWHDDIPVLIRKGQAYPVVSFLDGFEAQSAGNGALRMGDRRFERPQRVKCPDDVQFAGVFRRRITEREYFQLHDRPKSRPDASGITSCSPGL